MLLKVTRKVLSDRNTCIVSLFYRLYGNTVHIIIVTSLILLLLSYHPRNWNNMDIDYYKIMMLIDNLHWDWGNCWRRQPLYLE